MNLIKLIYKLLLGDLIYSKRSGLIQMNALRILGLFVIVLALPGILCVLFCSGVCFLNHIGSKTPNH